MLPARDEGAQVVLEDREQQQDADDRPAVVLDRFDDAAHHGREDELDVHHPRGRQAGALRVSRSLCLGVSGLKEWGRRKRTLHFPVFHLGLGHVGLA